MGTPKQLTCRGAPCGYPQISAFTINYQLSTALITTLSTINYQLSTINYQLSTNFDRIEPPQHFLLELVKIAMDFLLNPLTDRIEWRKHLRIELPLKILS